MGQGEQSQTLASGRLSTTTFRLEYFGRVVLYRGDDRDPSEADWVAYIDKVAELAAQHGSVRVCVRVERGAPNPTQRRLAVEKAEGIDYRTALITSNRMMRAVMTAFRWLGHNETKAFAPGDDERVYLFLGLTEEERGWLRRQIR